jgi:inner membrane protein involved in colicin E2 resistance
MTAETVPQPSKSVYLVSRISIRLRVVIASLILAAAIAIDFWLFPSDQDAVIFATLVSAILALLIVFRPRWIDYWNDKNRKEIESGDSDLRRWIP